MKVFLTGATGYIGSVVAEYLQAAGHSVIGLARNEAAARKLEQRHIQPYLGNLEQPEALIPALQHVDGVIHTAFIHNFDDWAGAVRADCRVIDAMVMALAGSGKPLIGTSDTSVLGDTGSIIAAETSPIASNFFLAERAKAEQAILQARHQQIRSVVLRLPLYIYGRGGGTSYVPMRIEEAQRTGIAYFVAPGDHLVSAVHVENVARLYVMALEKATAGSIFQAVTESGISERAIATAVSQLVGCPVQGLSYEQAVAQWGRGIATFFAINNQTSADQARQIGWQPQPRLSLLEDIAQTVLTPLSIAG